MATKDTIDAFERGLTTLVAFDQGSHRLTIQNVAQRTGQSRAGARRNLLTLVKLGYARLEGRHFALTPKVLALSRAFLASDPLFGAASPVLLALADETKAAASITLLEGGDVVYAMRAQPEPPVRPHILVGARYPAHATSSGRVLLAHLHRYRLEAWLRESAPDPAPTSCWQQEVRSLLRATAVAGWAMAIGEAEPDAVCVSVPLRAPDGQVRAALNLGSCAHRATEAVIAETYLPALRRSAARIERMLPRA